MNTYSFTTDIKCPETGVVLFADFECDVAVSITISDGQLDATSLDVLVDGISLKDKSPLSQAIAYAVMEEADQDLSDGGELLQTAIADHGYQWLQGPETDGQWVAA